jgi:hypothetical protein
MLFPDLISVKTLIAQPAQGAWSDRRHPNLYRGVAVVAPDATTADAVFDSFQPVATGYGPTDRS